MASDSPSPSNEMADPGSESAPPQCAPAATTFGPSPAAGTTVLRLTDSPLHDKRAAALAAAPILIGDFVLHAAQRWKMNSGPILATCLHLYLGCSGNLHRVARGSARL